MRVHTQVQTAINDLGNTESEEEFPNATCYKGFCYVSLYKKESVWSGYHWGKKMLITYLSNKEVSVN